MARALELAKLGTGYTSPNPMVGCVIVKDGRIIGEGWHMKYGGLHAERNAFLSCIEDTKGAELYVTLEPCCHHGKTPPCTEAIVEHGIKRVIVGCTDPNPLVGGKGIEFLREHGIEVTMGVLEEECRKLNEVFFHYISTKEPFVVLKYAMTLDGKIASCTGNSKWITGEDTRGHVHYLRKKYTGIMVGIGTVLADDPMLDCRIDHGVNPIRIICDSNLRIPLESKIVKSSHEIETIIAFCKGDEEKKYKLSKAGVTLMEFQDDERINLKKLMERLGEKGVDSILLEGGGTLNEAALEAGIIKKAYVYIAPKIIGGKEALTPIEGKGRKQMSDAFQLEDTTIAKFENDFCIEGYLRS
ncbi:MULTISPECIES: bifunctional diaminohydroxyphosphoribosylaminopyrimidine deaminase/5-amino-6-(5-phosphoribosylamino)uracil reductase RibD [unclassified Clostridium]|uniref:bifunctional diaminohydroxyphosphoribosylaminopyrimidine deaminase/5-amino-6-(5-phosphoribosylamino)uracil reductase RibD n=1 Tax=unclassified Clostridium TaxID=2614128 RepID=UPI0025BE931B|nr:MULTISPECIES: bifunctional diaminohydroxyphosphoribosylaminopyrimidine deaminase/5-amino-6-(5-phosphoribosylamino)uracil reductase RibD [unclassified Clostridium]